ncbi:MAG TPA: cytochrome c peroxidase [Flavobacteriales bacterium]|jgi:cytochrome c peroxidase|nr:cytochrome c peroxidase [Flavobacteriales bacterium]
MNARWTKYIERSAMRGLPWYLCVPVLVVMTSCDPDDPVEPDPNPPGGGQVYTPTPYTLTYPSYFSPMPIPANNPLTEEGIRLGRFLLYEERLSGDNTQSCASCHGSAVAFTDHGNRFSTGIDGIQGTRNAMALQNLGWETSFFWDGRAATLEEQILMPVMDPIEMHEEWPDALAKLQADPVYPTLFLRAFGTPGITQERTAKAIAQFLRTMVSSNSKYDRMVRGEELFTVEEQFGFELTTYEGGLPPDVPMGQGGADCFHCHPSGGGRFTDGQIRNNGLDPESLWSDLGLGALTGLPQDRAKFKTPSLRNVALTAPYMHDGRFQTLEEVIEHYNSGGHASTTVDPNMKYTTGGLQLSAAKKAQLIAFLHTLTDTEFVNDPRFQDPGPPTLQ